MQLAVGVRLGPYEIVAPLGAGGMGEVYRARDTRLDRIVAVKVLSGRLSADPQLRERFEREARVVSQLSHPHICALYDVGRSDDLEFLVMEFLDGETLAARIERGPVKLDDALKIAIEIAGALQAAHRMGIVHRDLKPGNVMLTRAGTKLLDFGLAKAVAPRAAAAGLTAMPTTPPSVTAAGMILGTLQYMAPEQLEGRDADARTDIFAFGCLLYEVVTGAKAFPGKSQASLISAILRDDPPPLSTSQPLTPPALDHIVRTCLAKEADERWQTAADLRRELTWIADQRRTGAGDAPRSSVTQAIDTASIHVSQSSRAWRERAIWSGLGLAAGAIVAGIAARALLSSGASKATGSTHASVRLESGTQLLGADPLERSMTGRPSRRAVALSPDGRTLVFSSADKDATQLYRRPLDQPSATPIPGTRGAENPFFSPDGRWIGFWADGALKKIPAAGGPAIVILQSPQLNGADWASDDTIVFARAGPGDGLFQVSASGGAAKPLTTVEKGAHSHRLPHVLPDGDTVLFTVVPSTLRWNDARIAAVTRSTGRAKTIVENGADGQYVASGDLVFTRMGTLLAVPFDASRLETRGSPVGVLENVMQSINSGNSSLETGAAQVSVSRAGTLAYAAGGPVPDKPRPVLWLDRTGARSAPLGLPPNPYLAPRTSRDGRTIGLFSQRTLKTEDTDIWTYSLSGGVATKITPAGSRNSWVAFSADSRRVIFSSRTPVSNLYWKAVDGSGAIERLTTSEFAQFPGDCTPDGRYLIFVQSEPQTDEDIWLLSLADRKATPLMRTAAQERWPAISPDGRWLAYGTNETGRQEVYVQPFPGPGPRTKVSPNGGAAPVWAPNGKTLYYVEYHDDNTAFAMAVDIVSGTSFSASTPKRLFDVTNYGGGTPMRGWDVGPDGRFLVVDNKRPTETTTELQLVLNWFSELRTRVP
jgi:eukaryotic-like serine/threonine-protein kinase